MNKVILIGRLGNDPEVKDLKDGHVSNFSLAVDDGYMKDNNWVEQVEWVRIKTFRKTKFQKGDLVSVEGAYKTDTWEGENGEKKYSTYVLARSIRLLSRKERAGDTTEETDDLPF